MNGRIPVAYNVITTYVTAGAVPICLLVFTYDQRVGTSKSKIVKFWKWNIGLAQKAQETRSDSVYIIPCPRKLMTPALNCRWGGTVFRSRREYRELVIRKACARNALLSGKSILITSAPPDIVLVEDDEVILVHIITIQSYLTFCRYRWVYKGHR